MQTEDGQIIYQCLNGDPAMFGVLVDKYRQGIYALAYSKIGNFHDAQDITQEAFIKAFRKLHTLKHWETFALWLSTIANNLCKDFIRAKAKRPDRDFVEDQSPDLVDNTSINSYHNDLVHKSLQEALNSLPEIYRQVIALHYLSGYKSMDIAKLLGISPRTVTERLKIGRERLKEEMITMMSETFKEQRLSAGFTFRIVEIVKRIKIQPVSTMKGLPWGLSLATGIIIAVLSLNPYMPQLDQFGTISGAPLLSESKALKVGEIPVDVVKTSNLPLLSSKMGKGKSGEPKQPDMQNAFFAPQGKEGTWEKKNDMLEPRWGMATCVVNDKIYAIGGSPDNNLSLSTVEEYDPFLDKWTKKSNMPTPRWYFATVVVKGKMYAMGGVLANWVNATAVVEEYDPSKDSWTRKADMLIPDQGFSASVVDDKIYVFDSRRSNSVEEYDPSKDEWTRKSNIPQPLPRWGLSTCVVNGKIYVIGGWDCVNVGPVSVTATVDEYDPIKDTWVRKANIPTARYAAAAVTVNGKIYVIGGSDNAEENFASVEVYDPTTDTWMKETEMPNPRQFLRGEVINGKIYLLGGAKFFANPLPTVEVYTPKGW